MDTIRLDDEEWIYRSDAAVLAGCDEKTLQRWHNDDTKPQQTRKGERGRILLSVTALQAAGHLPADVAHGHPSAAAAAEEIRLQRQVAELREDNAALRARLEASAESTRQHQQDIRFLRERLTAADAAVVRHLTLLERVR